jgi:two-component system, NarL family, nitrate/nitrite response regulator NarL
MKLLIVDDHAVVREGLAAVLAQSGGATVLQAAGAAEALALVETHTDLDVALLDLAMPGMDGIAAIQEFSRRRPELPVIVLSSSEDPDDIRRALGLGALGYIPKSASAQTLLSAIAFVIGGNVYVPPSILTSDAPTSNGSALRLTERQFDVLRLLCEGRSNKEIANLLVLSDKTVKTHVTAIFRSLNVVSRTQAAAAARKLGLL